MKKTIKVYLETETESKLKHKAEDVGINGRAWLTRYLEKIAPLDLAILDNNVRNILKLIAPS